MAIKKEDNKNNDNEELGYIKVHKDKTWLEVKQIRTGKGPWDMETTINSNKSVVATHYRDINKKIITPPWGNGYVILKEILEEDGFEIDSFSACAYPTHDKDGNPIIY